MVFYGIRQITSLSSYESIPVLPYNHCDYHPLFTPLIPKMLHLQGTRLDLAIGLISFLHIYKEGVQSV
jgi:hypothetical protein